MKSLWTQPDFCKGELDETFPKILLDDARIFMSNLKNDRGMLRLTGPYSISTNIHMVVMTETLHLTTCSVMGLKTS